MPELALSPRRPWEGRRVVLGVTGGIAAYKSIQVARDLTRLGATVDVVLTRAAQKFVAALSFEGVTGRPALTDLFSADGAALHVKLGREADVVCVAPATADFLARAAQGRADDLICTTLLATRAPVVICPAMNDRMFEHPQVQANVTHLIQELGYAVAGPAEGPLAVGEGEGPGRMLEPWQIEEHVGRALAQGGPLAGRAFAGFVVVNYLYRPLMDGIIAALDEGGILIYETFARGNDRFQRPRNPDHLLKSGELLELVEGRLQVVSYEHGIDETADIACVKQRLCAVNDLGRSERDDGEPAPPSVAGK